MKDGKITVVRKGVLNKYENHPILHTVYNPRYRILLVLANPYVMLVSIISMIILTIVVHYGTSNHDIIAWW
jgi:hypothetical protein